MVSLDLVLDVRLCYFLKSKLLCELGQGEGLSWEPAERAWLWALGCGQLGLALPYAGLALPCAGLTLTPQGQVFVYTTCKTVYSWIVYLKPWRLDSQVYLVFVMELHCIAFCNKLFHLGCSVTLPQVIPK